MAKIFVAFSEKLNFNKSSEPLEIASGKALNWKQEPKASLFKKKLKETAEMENSKLIVNQSRIFSFMSRR